MLSALLTVLPIFSYRKHLIGHLEVARLQDTNYLLELYPHLQQLSINLI